MMNSILISAAIPETPILREWRGLTEFTGTSGAESAEAIIALLARVAQMKPVTWHDAQVALYLSRELSAVLIDQDKHQSADEEIRRLGAIGYSLQSNAIDFIETVTGTTLAGSAMSADMKN
jgi:hypothetical protein